MAIGIYKIKNKINGKMYIGQSVDIERRWRDHIRRKNDLEVSHYPLYQALNKYGIDNFDFNIVEECKIEELNEKETLYIEFYDSFNNGYNQNEGGDVGINYIKLSKEEVDEIIQLLKNSTISGLEIAKKYNVGNDTISMINNGKMHRRDISYPIRNQNTYCIDCGIKITSQAKRCEECNSIAARKVPERPNSNDLLKDIALNGFAAVGRKYGVSDNTIRKWCSNYGLPTKTKEIKKLYGNHVEKETTTPKIHTDFYFKNDKHLILFQDTREAAEWLLKNNYTSATVEAIQGSITRVLNGKRKTYLKSQFYYEN